MIMSFEAREEEYKFRFKETDQISNAESVSLGKVGAK